MKTYAFIIIKNHLASLRKVNPVDITDEEAQQCWDDKQVADMEIRISDPFPSYSNGIKSMNQTIAFVDKEGYWYYDNIFEARS